MNPTAEARKTASIRVRETRRIVRGRWASRITGRLPVLVVLAVAAMSAACWFAAYLLRFDFALPDPYAAQAVHVLLYALPIQVACFHFNGVFRILWPYVGVGDALVILRAAACATGALFAVDYFAPGEARIPASVLLLDGVLVHVGVTGLFLFLRVAREARLRADHPITDESNALIVGAGGTGAVLLREIERTPGRPVRIVGFVDDDPTKQGTSLRGVPVLGGTGELVRLAREKRAGQVLITLTAQSGARLREIVAPLLDAGLAVRVLPPVGRVSRTSPLLSQLKEVAIEDLLRREPIRLDQASIGRFLGGKRVLVTGAAGSIGSELCRQILKYGPAKLVALDWAETPLHDLLLELKAGPGGRPVTAEQGDVTDRSRIREIFARHSPEVVFHAAALKHVPVCEDHPREAVRVNVGGTRTLAEQAVGSGTGVFVMISTDKAVNPSSVMGSTKRASELVIQRLQDRGGATRFAAVRFGNVLGSNGSVLRIFKSQLDKGGPLTVTHPDMRRYFMTVTEAVELVLEAAIQGRGGEIFELDMGRPVRIVDLAEDFIRLSGLVPGRDIAIEFTGVRPGEKLFEELYLHSETVVPTSHPKVLCLKRSERGEPDPSIRFCLERMGSEPDADPVLSAVRADLRRMLAEAAAEGVSIP